ncbi:uncharacterized protein PV06_10655 [Exophiala oligosperma]|uniref:Ornithine aminotransferase n=1 Tax=Exophiala oligosperma TaxID=215243 RepID=A0A0D2BI00_9EURO|nr:uncharacterized protein PV06_10655 [Exophiala oligosperma]KIW37022.1 hypothetical protein PV06_10655 [Exophiala oligosperma]
MGSVNEIRRSTGELGLEAQKLLKLENQYCVGGFLPLPAYISRGNGVVLFDADGKSYLDFIAMFSAGNLGQCHPKLVRTVVELASKSKLVTLANAALRVAEWPPFAEMMCKRFGYDQINATVSGTEAADAAVKIARKWGLQVKKVPQDRIKVLGVGNNYHGLSSGIWPIMEPTDRRKGFGVTDPSLSNLNPSTGEVLRYGSVEDMEKCLAEHHQNVAAVMMECIHGHAPTFQEDIDFARGVALLYKKYGVLFISDKVRMGAGKTGRWLCSEWLGPDVKADMIVLGKSLTGGAYPASFVLGNKETMSLVTPYTCAGTFANTPLGIACARTATEIIDEEGLVERTAEIGRRFVEWTKDWKQRFPYIAFATNRGADLQLVMKPDCGQDFDARRFAALAMSKGLLTHPLHGSVRMSVPMVITDEQLLKGFQILEETASELKDYDFIAGDNM